MIQMESLDTKRRLLQNANDLRAFKLHEQRIAKLYTHAKISTETRWIAQNPHWEH